MSAMKRMLEEVAGLVHDAKRDELEAMLKPWDDCQKVALIMEAISMMEAVKPNRATCGSSCPCYEGDEA
jgi:hypothetical protein